MGLLLLAEVRAIHLPANDVACSATISACEKAAQWQGALALLDQISLRKMDPNVVICSAAIGACENAHHWTRALALFLQMLAQGPAPNDSILSSVVAACAKGQVWEFAVEVFTCAQRFHREEQQHALRWSEAVVHSALLGAVAAGRQWKKAVICLTNLPKRCQIGSVHALEACASTGEAHHLMALLAWLTREENSLSFFGTAALLGRCGWPLHLPFVAWALRATEFMHRGIFLRGRGNIGKCQLT